MAPRTAIRPDNTTRFLNVDLDIYAKFDLQPLAAAFGLKVIVLYVGRERGRYSAHLELNSQPTTADAAIRGFTLLIHGLPRAKKGCGTWRQPAILTFGVQSAADAKLYEIKLAVPTIKAVSCPERSSSFHSLRPGSTHKRQTIIEQQLAYAGNLCAKSMRFWMEG